MKINNPKVKFYANSEYSFEVVLKNGQCGYTKPTYSFSDLDNNMDDENACDRLTTLQIYYEPNFINENDLEIYNDGYIYRKPLGELIEDYNLYEYVKREYGVNCRTEPIVKRINN